MKKLFYFFILSGLFLSCNKDFSPLNKSELNFAIGNIYKYQIIEEYNNQIIRDVYYTKEITSEKYINNKKFYVVNNIALYYFKENALYLYDEIKNEHNLYYNFQVDIGDFIKFYMISGRVKSIAADSYFSESHQIYTIETTYVKQRTDGPANYKQTYEYTPFFGETKHITEIIMGNEHVITTIKLIGAKIRNKYYGDI